MSTSENLSASLPVAGTQAVRARVPELVVISGKGGTGKTSVVASFAVLACNSHQLPAAAVDAPHPAVFSRFGVLDVLSSTTPRPSGRKPRWARRLAALAMKPGENCRLAKDVVVADCDVDAADLHLVLAPEILEAHPFVSGHEAVIRQADCDASGNCCEVCRFGAVIAGEGSSAFVIDPLACEGCGVCVELCPARAIDFPERDCGDWFSSTTRIGPMVHARLGIAAENSGKLVSTVRNEAKKIAARNGNAMILIDGPPGIGCPVIAALTGATAVLVVTEPTVSGPHDMERVLELTDHFQIPTAVCINRWDINPEGAGSIEARARNHGATIVGRIRYDAAVTRAQVEGRTVVELGSDAADDIRTLWGRVQQWMEESVFPEEEC